MKTSTDVPLLLLLFTLALVETSFVTVEVLIVGDAVVVVLAAAVVIGFGVFFEKLLKRAGEVTAESDIFTLSSPLLLLLHKRSLPFLAAAGSAAF